MRREELRIYAQIFSYHFQRPKQCHIGFLGLAVSQKRLYDVLIYFMALVFLYFLKIIRKPLVWFSDISGGIE